MSGHLGEHGARLSEFRSGSARDGRPRLVVLSGPSGVGKSSVVTELRRQAGGRGDDVHVSVSMTTRAPRPGERDGQHYRFVDRATFDRMIATGKLLEHAEYAGNRYGTPRQPVLDALAAGRPSLLEIEVQGAMQVKGAVPDALLVMLVPPSWADLVRRLTGRGTEDPEVVSRRLALARAELDAANAFDEVVVNDDVKSAAGRLLTLLFGG